MNINFSIIIPHKNRPKEIVRCLESIPTRSDLEIIIVDDDSDEAIVDFSCFPQTDRSDVRVVRVKDSKGAGKARNVGIEHAKGKWLIFADCDDFFSGNLSDILDQTVESNDDLIYFNVICVSEQTLKPITNPNFDYHRPNIEKAVKKHDCTHLRYSMVTPWGKIIRKSVVDANHITFDERPVGNDLMFSLKVGYYAKKVNVHDILMYNWVISSNSLTSLKTVDKCDCHLDVNYRKNLFLKERGLSKYRTNLFKQIKRYKGHGVLIILSRLMRIIRYTEKKYLLIDLWDATMAFIKKV